MARKAIRKKDRFEVFKRDKFTCQYCGRKSPDVVLEIDHVHPVSKGGSDVLLNYVTACSECNNGKGPHLLSDDTVVERQRQQAEVLAAKREQIAMMAQWQEGLLEIDTEAVASLVKIWESYIPRWKCNAVGVESLRKAYSKFGFVAVAEAIKTSSSQYLKHATDNTLLPESVELAFGKIYGICVIRTREKTDPDASKPAYIRGILRNRLTYVNDKMVIPLVKDARLAGWEWDEIKAVACKARSWTDFCRTLAE